MTIMMKSAALVILAVALIVGPLVHGLPDDQSPEAVQKWFQEYHNTKPKLTKLHFYLNNIASKNPPTSVPVAQANTTAASPTRFGLITVLDGKLTEEPLTKNPDAKVIGRAQGFFTFSSQEEMSALVTLNFVFTDGKFNGSTLSVVGRNPITATHRELPILGGSGEFRLAQGIATATTNYVDFAAGDDIVEVNMVFFRHTLPYGHDFDEAAAAEL